MTDKVLLQDRLKRIFDDAGGSDALTDLLAEFGFEGSRELAETIVMAMGGNAALIEAGDTLNTYAGHDPDCWGKCCSCGYTDAQKAWREIVARSHPSPNCDNPKGA